MKVALFVPCLTDQFAPRAGIASALILEHLGCEVAFPEDQTCCGQPLYNAGRRADAASLARRMEAVFRDHDAVVTPSGSCAAMVRHVFPELNPTGRLARRTWELAAFLREVLEVDLAALGCRWEGRASLHVSCHGRRLPSAGAAAALLDAVAALECAPLAPDAPCCGFGGAFSVDFPAVATAIAAPLVEAARASGAPWVICADAGCALHLEGACRRAGLAHVAFRHPAEVIAEGLGLLPRAPRMARGGAEHGGDA